MFTRKLGRFLGLVFVLAAAIGGVSAAAGAEQKTGAPTAGDFSTLTIVWD